MRDRYNLVPGSMAVLLHAALVVVLVVGVDLTRASPPAVPLAIQGTLVTEAVTAPPIREPEPEPEPVVQAPEPEPEPEEPDPAELARLAAEEAKRRQDQLEERQRLERIKQQEEERRLAEERERREEEERKRREAELERQREEAEQKRLADIKRQQEENERLRREAEAAQRMAEIEAEDRRLAALDAGAREAYVFAIQQKIRRNWVPPASARPDTECDVRVTQLPGGEVINATIVRCNGDAAVQRSIEAAVHKASPLPQPADPGIFERTLMLTFKPEQ